MADDQIRTPLCILLFNFSNRIEHCIGMPHRVLKRPRTIIRLRRRASGDPVLEFVHPIHRSRRCLTQERTPPPPRLHQMPGDMPKLCRKILMYIKNMHNCKSSVPPADSALLSPCIRPLEPSPSPPTMSTNQSPPINLASDNVVAFSIPDRFRKFAFPDLKVADDRTIKIKGSAVTAEAAGNGPEETSGCTSRCARWRVGETFL